MSFILSIPPLSVAFSPRQRRGQKMWKPLLDPSLHLWHNIKLRRHRAGPSVLALHSIRAASAFFRERTFSPVPFDTKDQTNTPRWTRSYLESLQSLHLSCWVRLNNKQRYQLVSQLLSFCFSQPPTRYPSFRLTDNTKKLLSRFSCACYSFMSLHHDTKNDFVCWNKVVLNRPTFIL